MEKKLINNFVYNNIALDLGTVLFDISISFSLIDSTPLNHLDDYCKNNSLIFSNKKIEQLYTLSKMIENVVLDFRAENKNLFAAEYFQTLKTQVHILINILEDEQSRS